MGVTYIFDLHKLKGLRLMKLKLLNTLITFVIFMLLELICVLHQRFFGSLQIW
jgi:hypothetical protein